MAKRIGEEQEDKEEEKKEKKEKKEKRGAAPMKSCNPFLAGGE